MDLEREIKLIFNKVGLDGRKQTQKEIIALFYKYSQALQLLQTDVSSRREQLLSFKEWENKYCILPYDANSGQIVDAFLANN